MVTFTEEILIGKLHFLSSVNENVDNSDDDDDDHLYLLNDRSKIGASLISSGNYHITECSYHRVLQEWGQDLTFIGHKPLLC